MSELRGFEAINDELKAIGATVLGISVEPPDEAKNKVVAKQDLNFDILCDTNHDVIRRYGLVHKDAGPKGDLAIPTNILIDKDGSIAWRYTPKRIQERLDPADVLLEVKKLTNSG